MFFLISISGRIRSRIRTRIRIFFQLSRIRIRGKKFRILIPGFFGLFFFGANPAFGRPVEMKLNTENPQTPQTKNLQNSRETQE